MAGKGVLLECLDDERIEKVTVVNRRSLDMHHDKLRELIYSDFFHMDDLKSHLTDVDACFFTLGVSAVGMNEDSYSHITYDLSNYVADMCFEANPNMCFCYVSGQGTDSSEKGRSMWARVKGKTENMLLNRGFGSAFMFRPGYIQPMRGIRSSTWWYQLMYDIFGFLYPVLKRLFPGATTNSVNVGRAMIEVACNGYSGKHLENKDINTVAEN